MSKVLLLLAAVVVIDPCEGQDLCEGLQTVGDALFSDLLEPYRGDLKCTEILQLSYTCDTDISNVAGLTDRTPGDLISSVCPCSCPPCDEAAGEALIAVSPSPYKTCETLIGALSCDTDLSTMGGAGLVSDTCCDSCAEDLPCDESFGESLLAQGTPPLTCADLVSFNYCDTDLSALAPVLPVGSFSYTLCPCTCPPPEQAPAVAPVAAFVASPVYSKDNGDDERKGPIAPLIIGVVMIVGLLSALAGTVGVEVYRNHNAGLPLWGSTGEESSRIQQESSRSLQVNVMVDNANPAGERPTRDFVVDNPMRSGSLTKTP